MTRRELEDEIQTPKDLAVERHYTETEIAAGWHLHPKTIHRMFHGVPGVLEFEQDGHKSRRIPESVMLRVHRDLRQRS